ncbi:MAG: hypothetical protein LAO78_11855 [Acidobacteriia bacterium]|nr:hypothetical protein [Terriglobia bacterium]
MDNTRNDTFHNRGAARNVGRGLLVALMALALTGFASAQNNTDSETFLKFKGGIGVIPVTGVAANGTVNLNVVRGVPPGAPWRIADLEAAVGPDGHIKVVGRGLLLASGNGIGTNAGQSVHATLFCGAAGTATAHSSNLAGVALAADGDFRIDDFLSPALPTPCDSPVLLIRNVGGVWFAAGIPKLQEEDRR